MQIFRLLLNYFLSLLLLYLPIIVTKTLLKMDPTLYQSFLKYLTDPNYKDNLESKQQRQLKQTTRHYVAINKILFKKHRLPPIVY